jgi:predicted ABC-type ATPase
MESLASPRPRLVVVAGTNGAGKTTIIDLLPDLAIGEQIDPDRIAREMNSRSPETASLRAGRVALARIADILAAREDLTVETTLAGRQPLRLLQHAHDLGYHVTLVFVGTSDFRLNVNRVGRRVADGGHAIDADDIERRYTRSLDHLPEATSLADTVAVFDNSGEPKDLRVIYDRDENGERVADDAPRWFTSSRVRRGGS